jgi:hypothetical protein
MKSFDTELKKYAEKVHLKVSERQALRERILSYMEYHPLPKQSFSKEEIVGIPSESFTTFHFTWFHARVAGSIAVLVLILAPFVAERAMPGEVLYLVKTGFNETIQKQLADSPYEKIEFETKLMERRITEARALASEGKLTEEVKTQIAETVKVHTKAVQSGLAELKTTDADGAAIAQIAFNASLEVQSAVLDAEKSTENDSLIEGIRDVVNEARVEVASNQVENKPSFDGLMAQVEIETTRAYELFTAVKVSATPEEVADIDRRLSDINRLIGEAKEKHENPAPAVATTEVAEGEAVEALAPEAEAVAEETEEAPVDVSADDLAKTLGLLQKLIVFMTDIDIRKTVTLETLVPVVLSDAERTDLAVKEIESISEVAGAVTQRLEAIEDAGVKEKVEIGLAHVAELTEAARVSLKDADIATADGFLKEARTFVTDLDTVSQSSEVTLPEGETELPAAPEVTGTSTELVATTTSEIEPEF